MKTLVYFLMVMVMLSGCVTTSGRVAIVPSTTPEEDLKMRVKETLDRNRKQDEVRPAERPAAEPAPSSVSREDSQKGVTAEKKHEGAQVSIQEKHEQSAGSSAVPEEKYEALINLLEKKGLINKMELDAEIRRLREKSH